MNIKPRKGVEKLLPYRPGKPIEAVMKEYGLTDVVKLASNENPLGCSPKAIEAIQNTFSSLARYPDGNATNLREHLAKRLNVKPSQIIHSNGLDEVIALITNSYCDRDDEIIMGDITFPRYIQSAMAIGATPVVVPNDGFFLNVPAMLNSITEKTKIVWICNPNNPTGTIVSERIVLDFIQKAPKSILIILDEAYREYVSSPDYQFSSIDWLKEHENLVIMRTFSKAYGLAGLRIGYTIAHEDIITEINKLRGAFNVSLPAQAAAIAAFEDQDFVKKTVEMNAEGKRYLQALFEELNLTFAPSEANHLYVDMQQSAEEIFVKLQQLGVIVRPQGGTYVRVSIGTREENEKFASALKTIFKK